MYLVQQLFSGRNVFTIIIKGSWKTIHTSRAEIFIKPIYVWFEKLQYLIEEWDTASIWFRTEDQPISNILIDWGLFQTRRKRLLILEPNDWFGHLLRYLVTWLIRHPPDTYLTYLWWLIRHSIRRGHFGMSDTYYKCLKSMKSANWIDEICYTNAEATKVCKQMSELSWTGHSSIDTRSAKK